MKFLGLFSVKKTSDYIKWLRHRGKGRVGQGRLIATLQLISIANSNVLRTLAALILSEGWNNHDIQHTCNTNIQVISMLRGITKYSLTVEITKNLTLLEITSYLTNQSMLIIYFTLVISQFSYSVI